MKTKFLFSLFLVVIAGFILSCASSPPSPPIDPESLIGTTWVTARPDLFSMSLEIINETECFYTISNIQYHTTYSVKGNVITLPAIHDSWVLKGDTLYNRKGYPVFIKA